MGESRGTSKVTRFVGNETFDFLCYEDGISGGCFDLEKLIQSNGMKKASSTTVKSS
jgi:hypothetical protein